MKPDSNDLPRNPSGCYLFSVRRGLDHGADIQSAVSPNCIRQSVGSVQRAIVPQRQAECYSATQRGAVRRAATKHSLSSMQWSRGPGRGGGLPSPQSSPHSCVVGRGSRKFRAPKNRGGLRRNRQILIEYNSALRWAAKHIGRVALCASRGT